MKQTNKTKTNNNPLYFLDIKLWVVFFPEIRINTLMTKAFLTITKVKVTGQRCGYFCIF